MEIREAVIVDTVRTPIGKRKGALAGWHPTDLLGPHAATRSSSAPASTPSRVDDVVGGCVTQVGEQGCNVTRNAWVAAGLPQSVPATTVDRQCGSSQQAVHFVAAGRDGRRLRHRHRLRRRVDDAGADGVERAGRHRARSRPDFMAAMRRPAARRSSRWRQILAEQFEHQPRGHGRVRRSSRHRRAAAATDAGHFAGEIVPVPIKDEDGALTGEHADRRRGHPARHDAREAGRAAVGARRGTRRSRPTSPPATRRRCPTAPSAMLIADRGDRRGARAARSGPASVHFAVAADDAVLVLSAPNPATRKLLDRSGHDDRRLRRHRVQRGVRRHRADVGPRVPARHATRYNPRGGAIAIGHPLGASGVRLMTTLLNQLEATGGRFGFQTMCEGGGQANATVIERLLPHSEDGATGNR